MSQSISLRPSGLLHPTANDTRTTSHTQVLDSAGKGSVSFKHVSKTYVSSAGPVHALEDISLDITAGSIFGIIGRSGAGKSSLLRTINLLEKPSSGQILVDNTDISQLNDEQLVQLRRRIGMIFQHFNLLSAKTVFENVALPLQLAGQARSQVHARVSELLKLVGLEDKHHVRPSRLSGGQKQRVGIARALATNPEILLCDEATSALDPETTQAILQLLRDINQKLGITIILITHEMSVIREIADQVLVLEQGKIAEHGPVWRVFGAPQHPATQALLAPLQQTLPAELRARLVTDKPQVGTYEQWLQLSYQGKDALEPDLRRISQTLQADIRIVHAAIERLQGHTQGRLIVALDSHYDIPPLHTLSRGPHAIAHHSEILGYVLT